MEIDMPSSKRIARLEKDLALLEASFEHKLVDALRECAAGHYGLFGVNDASLDLVGLQRLKSGARRELLELGQAIEKLRARLG